MSKSSKHVDLGVMDEKNYAMIEGKTYPIKFIGNDAYTYRHLPGCLAESSPKNCCQCGALGRTAKIYGVYVPETDESGNQTISNEPFS